MNVANKKIKNFVPSVPQLLILLDAARSMGEKRDLDSLLNYILEKTKEAMQCDRCSIFLHDPPSRSIWSRVAMGEGATISFPEGVGIAGETISTGSAILVEDAYKDTRFNPDIDEKTGYRTKSILSVPMINTKGIAVGCLQAINKLSGEFNEADCELALAFASQSAVSIGSALLHEENNKIISDLEKAQASLEEKVDQIQSIYEIDTIRHNTSSLSDFFSKFFDKALASLEADSVSTLLEWDQGRWAYFMRDKHQNSSKEEIIFESNDILERLASRFSGKRVMEDTQGDFKFLDEYLSFTPSFRMIIPFSFLKTRQDGSTISQKGMMQVCYLDKKKQIIEYNAFLEVISSNIKTIVEKVLTQERQEQSGRLETIGKLSSTIFHDIKNPMSSIRGLAEILSMSAESIEPAKITKFADKIQTQVDRCVGMIGEILEFTRGEKNFNFVEGSLGEFLGQIRDLLEVDADRSQIQLKVQVDSDSRFFFDKGRLMRAVFNLTNNALEILQPGDSIVLEGRTLDSGLVEISVTDSGPGVPSHLQDTLFEVFVTFGKKQGTGLGLNIVRQIVEGHGGTIRLDRDYKDGARFVMTLSPSPSAVP